MHRDNLVKAMKAVIPGVARKDIVEVFTCICFVQDKIMSTNGQVYIRYQLDEDSGLTLSVPGKPIYSILNSLGCESVELAETKKGLKITATNLKGKLVTPEVQADKSIDKLVQEPEDSEWIDFPKDLLGALKLCKFSCSRDQTEGVLTCVNVNDDVVRSTDKFRISQYKLTESTNQKMSLPVPLIAELEKYAGDIEEWCIKGNQVFFRIFGGRLVVGGPFLTGEYPDVSSFFTINPQIEIDLPEEISDVLLRQKLLLDDILDLDQETKITVTGEGIILSSCSKSVGEIEEIIETCVPEEGHGHTFFINPLFMIEILQLCKKMGYDDTNKIVSFCSNGFQHVLKTRAD